MQVPTVPVKIFLFLHLIFTSWAMAAFSWLPFSYGFCHIIMFMFGIWAIIQPASHDANQLFLLSVLFAVLNDCVLIGIYFDADANKRSSTRRFAVAFAFFNLFLKPITIIFILLGYQDNAGGFDYTQVFSSEQQAYQTVPEQSSQGQS